MDIPDGDQRDAGGCKNYEKEGDQYNYRQDDGKITARFRSNEKKMVLSHGGSRFYRRLFNLLVVVGALYLAVIFFLR